MECSAMYPIKYRLKDMWYTLGPNLIASQPPKPFHTKLNFSGWNYKHIAMGTKGIYSFADIERQRAAVLFPVEFRAITRTIASAAGGYGQNSQHLNLMSLLNPADLKSALASYWYEFEGAFRIFGAYSGAILMVIAFYKILTQVFGGGGGGEYIVQYYLKCLGRFLDYWDSSAQTSQVCSLSMVTRK